MCLVRGFESMLLEIFNGTICCALEYILMKVLPIKYQKCLYKNNDIVPEQPARGFGLHTPLIQI